MLPEHKQRLDEIGFIWNILSEAWEEGFNKLLQFKELEGHCKVPQRFKLDGYRLGQWVTVQRTRQNHLSPEQEQRLNELGFVWEVQTEAWEESFSELLKFKEAEGHCRVPARCELDGFKIGGWVNSQRSTKDTISPERRQRLDDVGFIWNASKDKT